MLKTLTEYFNTFANTGFGCLECSPEELLQPDLPGLQGFEPSRELQELGSSGSSLVFSSPRAGGPGTLLDPAAASFLCSANTKCAVE